MTIDPTQPQPEQGSAPDNGQAQSQGHRRRRRRRKNKSSQQAGMQGQPQQAQPQMQSPAPQQAAPQKPPQHHQNRKKKKFFQRSSGPAVSPGNSISGPPQGKRKGGRQRGPRTFVGPMDHSYRVANGNVADGPPSTIQMMSNGHQGGGSNYYPDVYSQPPAAARPAKTPTRTNLLLHRRSVLPGEDSEETAKKSGRQGRIP